MDEQPQPDSNGRAGWQRVHIGDAEIERQEHEYMILVFHALYLRAERPHGMNLWMTRRRDTGVDVYISPAAVAHVGAWLSRYQAADSPAPVEPVVLVAGHHYQPSTSAHRQPIATQRAARCRRYVPARYHYRSVRQFEGLGGYGPSFFGTLDLAPFVRRFACAWELPHPGRAREDFRL
ncbi:hypothetical protein [Salinisphaera sp. LB1]|uniref:hypothetical protein n=1 Tax=Salinisphaera sp. LB1 TaxID=2183911 RepID=UPI000D705153|nr:hypothetical protein [Salinisphaera sp. LB1]AWN16617.1 hypothetical protein SALB1_2419 [Salinisphaera sp. LB1]